MATLVPLLVRMEKGSGKKHENVTVDAGYESEENYKALKSRNQAAYIKPANYEKSKKRKYKTNAYMIQLLTPTPVHKETCFRKSTPPPAKVLTALNQPSSYTSVMVVWTAHRKNFALVLKAIEESTFQRISLPCVTNHLQESLLTTASYYGLTEVSNQKVPLVY